MFIGHYGPAIWDAQRGHSQPLLTLWQGFIAVQAMDFTAGFLTLLGIEGCLLYTSPSPRDQRGSRMPSSA